VVHQPVDDHEMRLDRLPEIGIRRADLQYYLAQLDHGATGTPISLRHASAGNASLTDHIHLGEAEPAFGVAQGSTLADLRDYLLDGGDKPAASGGSIFLHRLGHRVLLHFHSWADRAATLNS